MTDLDDLKLRARAKLLLEQRDPLKRYCPLTPSPKQRQFLDRPERYCLYGGATRGGKSIALMMAALMYVDRPDYTAVIVRNMGKDLRDPGGGLIPLSHDWLANTDASWSGSTDTWTFPNGAKIIFRHLDNVGDQGGFKGKSYQFIGVDECTEVPFHLFTYVAGSRLERRADSDIPLRVRLTTNPGGPYSKAYQDFFGIPNAPLKAPVHVWKERVYIPSTIEDNPFVDAVSYIENLRDVMGSIEFAQLRYGSWELDSSKMVYASTQQNYLPKLPGDVDPRSLRKFCGIDFGWNDATSCVVMGFEGRTGDIYVLSAESRKKWLPSDFARHVAELNEQHKFEGIVADVGGTAKREIEEMRQSFYLPVELADKNNKLAYINLMNEDFVKQKLFVLEDGAQAYINELTSLVWKGEGPTRKEHPSLDNHNCDAALYCWRKIRKVGVTTSRIYSDFSRSERSI